jgi:hypothetical protein
VSLEPYTVDVRPGEDFQNLIDILLGFFARLEGGREISRIESRRQLSETSESIAPTPYRHLTLAKLPKLFPEQSGSNTYYRNKVEFVIRNSFDQDIEIWSPLWESKEVSFQAPLRSAFAKEDKDSQELEQLCIALGANGEARGWIYLIEPSDGDGLEVRLQHRKTGCLMFLLKVGGKMRYAGVEI